MIRCRLRTIAVMVAIIAGACSTGTRVENSSSTPSRDVLTREQIIDTQSRTALDAVRSLRPSWLRPRGSGTSMRPPPIMVFIDNVRSGASIERLAAIDVESVEEIRWINARDATTRWGTGVAGGVIQVITRSPGGGSA